MKRLKRELAGPQPPLLILDKARYIPDVTSEYIVPSEDSRDARSV